jgi:hypothetical protein
MKVGIVVTPGELVVTGGIVCWLPGSGVPRRRAEFLGTTASLGMGLLNPTVVQGTMVLAGYGVTGG